MSCSYLASVDHVYKSTWSTLKSNQTIAILTPASSAACGVTLSLGSSYLLSGYTELNMAQYLAMSVSTCGLSSAWCDVMFNSKQIDVLSSTQASSPSLPNCTCAPVGEHAPVCGKLCDLISTVSPFYNAQVARCEGFNVVAPALCPGLSNSSGPSSSNDWNQTQSPVLSFLLANTSAVAVVSTFLGGLLLFSVLAVKKGRRRRRVIDFHSLPSVVEQRSQHDGYGQTAWIGTERRDRGVSGESPRFNVTLVP